MQKIEFKCSRCGKYIGVDRSAAGRQVECPNPQCKKVVIVPNIEDVERAEAKAKSYTTLTLILYMLGAVGLIAAIFLRVSFLSYKDIKEPQRPPILSIKPLSCYPGQLLKDDFIVNENAIQGLWSQTGYNSKKVIFTFKKGGKKISLPAIIDHFEGESETSVESMSGIAASKENPSSTAEGTIYYSVPKKIPINMSAEVNIELNTCCMVKNEDGFASSIKLVKSTIKLSKPCRVVKGSLYKMAQAEYNKEVREYNEKSPKSLKQKATSNLLFAGSFIIFTIALVITFRKRIKKLLGFNVDKDY